MWALGRDIRRSLPGLFWLDVFGKPYVDLIGRVRLVDLPVGAVVTSGDAVVLKLYESPESWSTPRAQADHAASVRIRRWEPDGGATVDVIGLLGRLRRGSASTRQGLKPTADRQLHCRIVQARSKQRAVMSSRRIAKYSLPVSPYSC